MQLFNGLNTKTASDPIDDTLQVLPVKAILTGHTDGGEYLSVPVTGEGHIEVAIHSPTLPFGAVNTETLTPVFQATAIYGLSRSQTTTATGTGAITVADNMFQCSTGTTAGSVAALQSRQRLKYRSGQGMVCRFTSLFTAPVASSFQIAGLGNGESAFYFGYSGISFGIFHINGGVREIRTLTISTASTSTQNVQVTLNGTVYTVTGMTNSGNVNRTSYEISLATFPGWDVEAIDGTVVFVSQTAGPLAGAFSVAQSGAGVPVAGSFATTATGVAVTSTFIAQSAWNGDKFDGTGPSGMTLDQTKGNVYQIGVQYLGFGAVVFSIETSPVTSNNCVFGVAHTLKFPNSRTTPSINQPSMRFNAQVLSLASTTNLKIRCGSYSGFIGGNIEQIGPRYTYTNQSTTVAAGAYYALATVRNDYTFKGRTNQSIVRIISFGAAHDDLTPVQFYLIRNGTLVGNPNFQAWATNSCTYVDSAATQVIINSNEDIIYSQSVGSNGTISQDFLDPIVLQPGEQITIAARTVTGTASWAVTSLNTREDQ